MVLAEIAARNSSVRVMAGNNYHYIKDSDFNHHLWGIMIRHLPIPIAPAQPLCLFWLLLLVFSS